MPLFGGYCPFPLRFGGRATRVKTITKSLQTQLGKKYDVTNTKGLAFIRINAMARALAAAWGQNQRLANQWDPKRVTDFLARWEKILGLAPNPGDSLTARRNRIGVARARVGEAMEQAVYDACAVYLGACFVGLANTSSAEANVWTPAGWPMGQHPSGPNDPTWMSTVAHLVVLTKQPSTMSNAEFFTTITSVYPALDSILSSWMTFNVVRDGPHGAGFFLDEPDLDLERFRI